MELLVRVVDKLNPNDAKLNQQLTKRGDVIHAAEDGHEWGIEELKNPEWRIIKLPDMKLDEAESYLAPEKPPDLKNQYVLRKRAKKIDLDALGIATDPKVDRATDEKAIAAVATDVLTASTMKTDPMLGGAVVIGPQPTDEAVIGPA